MHLTNERGGASAEFAVVLPVIILVLSVVLGGLGFAALRVSVVSAAHELARLEARGDTALATARSQSLPPGAHISRNREQGLLCVTVTAQPVGGLLRVLNATSTGCAAVSEAP